MERSLDKSVYDTKEGIATMVDTLEHLNQIAAARHEAGYARREGLNSFVVFGHLLLTNNGDTLCWNGNVLAQDAYATLPAVMTKAEFDDVAKERLNSDWKGFAGASRALPTATAVCPVCNKGWTIENCHDVESEKKQFEKFSLADYVGKTLGEAAEAIKKIAKARYEVPEWYLRRDSFVDSTPNELKTGGMENAEGWRDELDDIGPYFVIKPGDDTRVYVERFYHRACHVAYLNQQFEQAASDQMDALIDAMSDVGFTGAKSISIDMPEGMRAEFGIADEDTEAFQTLKDFKWHRVTTDEGTFIVGLFSEMVPYAYLKGCPVSANDLMQAMGQPSLPPNGPQHFAPIGDEDMLRSLLFLLKRSPQPAA